jgi:hypothetical protein
LVKQDNDEKSVARWTACSNFQGLLTAIGVLENLILETSMQAGVSALAPAPAVEMGLEIVGTGTSSPGGFIAANEPTPQDWVMGSNGNHAVQTRLARGRGKHCRLAGRQYA